MKIRNGFVSNSSSSSFVCNVCGEDQSGWDIGLEEAQMHECVNGHIFCDTHMTSEQNLDYVEIKKFCLENVPSDEYDKEEIEAMDNDDLRDLAGEWEYFEDDRYECPAEMCPICSFSEVNADDVYLYLLKKAGLSENSFLKQLKTEFKNYKEFEKFIK